MIKKPFIILTILSAIIFIHSASHGASIVEGPVARNKLERDVKELFCSEKFEALEKLAKELRTIKARFPEGHWKLYYFYNGLSFPKNRKKEQWDRWLALMEKWQRFYPDSVTARVARVLHGSNTVGQHEVLVTLIQSLTKQGRYC